jgi:hypothetical protein
MMVAAVIAFGAVAVALAGVLVLVLRMQASERREWVAERHTLVDRAIAKHTGEIIAMERTQRPEREPYERPTAVGLS